MNLARIDLPLVIDRRGCMNRRSMMLMTGIAALTATIPFPTARADTSASDEPLFSGDYETGDTSQYAAIELNGGTTNPQVVTSPTRSAVSKYACAYSLSGKQYRCETVPAYYNQPYVATEGSDLYYAWSVYYPENFPVAPWQVCGQWHQTYLGGSGTYDSTSPPMAIYVAGTNQSRSGVNSDPAHWYLANNGYNPWANGWAIDLGTVPRSEWTDVVVHAKFSSTASNCLVEVWINGIQIGSIVPTAPILYPTDTTFLPQASYFKIGYYRDLNTTTPATVYFDNVRIVDQSYAAVFPSI
jgi:hypothetical protein